MPEYQSLNGETRDTRSLSRKGRQEKKVLDRRGKGGRNSGLKGE